MYRREKPFREENYKPRKSHSHTPSFSSSLLDEIYRSIDGNDEKLQDFKPRREESAERHGGSLGDEEMASFREVCLVEKWIEKDAKQRLAGRRRHSSSLFPQVQNRAFQERDFMLFNNMTWSSSDSYGALSSSDTELFGRPSTKSNFSRSSTRDSRKEERFMFDGGQIQDRRNRVEDEVIKQRSRALKIYTNLKKMKQPISPGGKLRSFINSLFTSIIADGKKSTSLDTANVKASPSSTCSSFSRTYSPDSRKKLRDGVQKTVTFHPVGVIVDEYSKACGQMSICDEVPDRYNGRPPLPPNALAEKSYRNLSKADFSMRNEEEEEEDAVSDSSSDLFELDHMASFGKNGFCEELPVYETTYFDNKNRTWYC